MLDHTLDALKVQKGLLCHFAVRCRALKNAIKKKNSA